MKRTRRDRLAPIKRIARLVPGGMPGARWLRRSSGASLFQPFTDTKEERHPALFDTPLAAGYSADASRMIGRQPQELLYGPDARRLDGPNYGEALFRKN